MNVTFHGAAQAVTGSQHLVHVQGRDYLLDCGQYQGRRKEAEERNRNLPFSASSIEAVMLSHAHIDHSGNLPMLVKSGYHGPIYASPATIDLCVPMLTDSAGIQEKDALFLNKRHERRRALGINNNNNGEVQPLYTAEDAQATFPLFRPIPLHTRTDIGPGLAYESWDAGHILGSTCLGLTLQENGRQVRLGFSGDVGRTGLPIINDPESLPPMDYLIMESTYGDRLHKPIEAVNDKLAEIVNRTWSRGGRLIVPAFAVGRTQQLVLMLHELINAGRIPALPIFVDSPLAVNITDVYRKHSELFDAEARRFTDNGEDPFGFSRLRYIKEVGESKALNDLHVPHMVISASGMCEAGRILHHLKNGIGDPRNTILITGYQAANTLGRKLVEEWPEVPIFGEMMKRRAEVQKINELSGHADQSELLLWMKPMVETLRKVFLVHGEPLQQQALAAAIRDRYRLDAVAPSPGETHELN
ncbi:MAG TPA: MBL fold metallo-hydrolase [Bryobacteraceae bacterium]|nr:MBL fold metallo-hydrolase [Bryobacteraceae bacterium]